MIESETQRDIFDAVEDFRRDDQCVLFFHGCNAQGVMGSGVARQVKKRWPNVYRVYRRQCKQSHPEDLVGKVLLGSRVGLQVANAITQKDYGSDGTYADPEWIESCLDEVDQNFSEDNIVPVAVRVGCGLGGLNWEDVRPKFEQSELSWRIYYL